MAFAGGQVIRVQDEPSELLKASPPLPQQTHALGKGSDCTGTAASALSCNASEPHSEGSQRQQRGSGTCCWNGSGAELEGGTRWLVTREGMTSWFL